jgi:hypothetical protein
MHNNQQQQMLPTGESLCRYLEEEKTYWAIFFAGFNASNVTAGTFRYVGDIGPRIIPFLQPGGPPHTEFLQGAFTEDFLRRYILPRGPYPAFGEFGLYYRELNSLRYTGSQFRAVLQVANAIRGVVMIHPRDGTLQGPTQQLWAQDRLDLETVLQAYPNVTFLFHSRHDFFEQYVLPLMTRYPNLFYTYDTTHMLGGSWGASLQRGTGAYQTTQQFIDAVNRVGLNRIIEENVSRTRAWFQQYPDRILWGTDRGTIWTYDRAGRDLLLQVSRAFIGRLPAAVQEAYAFRNALRVFGRYFSNPAYFAQFANGVGWTSSVVLTNPSTTDAATGSFNLFDDRGQSLPVSLNASVPTSTSSFNISPLGSTVFTTTGAGNLVSGSAWVTSNAPLSTVVRFGLPSLGIAGVGESSPLYSLVTPAIRDANRGLDTGIAIVNPDPVPVTVELYLTRLDGSGAGFVTVDIAANGHLAKFIGELFPDVNAANFQGTLRARARGGRIAATALQLGSAAGEFTTFPAVAADPVTTTTELVFPQFANGSGFVSSVFLINPSASAVSGELSFLDDNGSSLAVSINGQSASDRIRFDLPAQGSASFTTDGQGPLISGSARVSATGGLGGVLSFSFPGLGIAGVGTSASMTGFITPVRRSLSSGLSTGVAIAAQASPVMLRLTLRNQNGEEIPGGDAALQLPPKGHIARFIHELFPNANTADFVGTMTLVSQGGEIAAMAIELGARPGEFTTLPVAALR